MLVPPRAYLRACLALVDPQDDSERVNRNMLSTRRPLSRRSVSRRRRKSLVVSIEPLCDESGGGGKVDADHSLIGQGRAL